MNLILPNSQTESPVQPHQAAFVLASGLGMGTWRDDLAGLAIQPVAYALGGTHGFASKPGDRMLSLPFCARPSIPGNAADRRSQNKEGGP